MASGATFSGTLYISSVSTVASHSVSATLTISAFVQHQFTLSDGLSDFILSLAPLSNPTLTWCLADKTVRVNAWPNLDSQRASAGQLFAALFVLAGGTSAFSGPGALHFANSSGSAAQVTVLQGM